MKIFFVNLSSLKFTVATPDAEPLGGSESCLCYLARQLKKNGHDVTVAARLPDNAPPVVMNIRHFPPNIIQDAAFFAAEKFDAIIICNAPIAAPQLRMLNPQTPILLWDHVGAEQPSMDNLTHPDVLNAIDTIVYVSDWQKSETETKRGITKPSAVIGNGLTPAFENMFMSPQDLLNAKHNRAAYTSPPVRGLFLLLKAMDGIINPPELDVFSSMRVYQESDDSFAAIYKQAEQNPHVHLHGSVSQTALAQKLKSCAYLTYSCIMPETYCIAVLEAMAAGMKIITTNLGAIPSTSMGYADIMPVTTSRGEDLIAPYRQLIEANTHAFQTQRENWAEKMFAQVTQVNQTCTWAIRARAWENLLGIKK